MKRRARGTTDTAKLDAMMREATFDCYDDTEQALGLFTMIEEYFGGSVHDPRLGRASRRHGPDTLENDRNVAICVRGHARQAIPILDLPLPVPELMGTEWIEAYRHRLSGA